MLTDHRTPYADALALAERLVERLRPACERIEIAGSLRRHTADSGDIDLLIIPRYVPITDLLGAQIGRLSLLDLRVEELRLPVLKQGDKALVVDLGEMHADLWLADPDTWGVKLLLRTGSNDFSHWVVAPKGQGGAMPLGMRCQEARIWRQGAAISTPEEADVFAALDMGWIPPEHRRRGLWGRGGARRSAEAVRN